MIAAVILAAGASRRMGSPKALLDYRGETFLNRLIRVLGAVCHPVVVVVGYHSESIRASVTGLVHFATNPDPDRGQLTSLQAGLAAVPRDVEGFLFTPVDSPSVEEQTVARLVDAFHNRKPETQFVIPRFQMKRGHPVLATAPLLEEFLSLPEGAQAKDVVHRLVPQTEYLDVSDPGILADVDNPEAYHTLLERKQ